MPNTGPGQHTKDISDGYHTFGELYEHRHALFLLALMFNTIEPEGLYDAWWTRNHHPDNEPMFDLEGSPGILVGLELPGMSIQYHMPERFLEPIVAYAKEVPHGPHYDGTTSPENVITYLKEFVGVVE